MTNRILWLIFVPMLVFLPQARSQTGAVAFSQSAYTATDTDITATITVILTGTPDGDSTVDYSAAGAATTNGTLNFTTTLFTNTFPVSVPSGLTTNVIVNLMLQTPTGSAVLGSPSAAVLTIQPTGGGSTGTTGTHVFPITLKGYVITVTNVDEVVKIKINNYSFNPSDHMVLVVDDDIHSINLGSIDSDSNVTYIASSTYAAILPNGQFSANLTFDSVTLSNTSINIVGTGDVQVRGSYAYDPVSETAKLNNANLNGTFNDSVADTILKATIYSSGKEYNIDDVTLP